MMDPVFGGLNLQDSLALADPLGVLVLLGAVAAAASLSVTEGINTCLADVSGNRPTGADRILTAWLDSLFIPPFQRRPSREASTQLMPESQKEASS